MNRLKLRELTRKKLGETTGAFWSDDEIHEFINEGCRDIAMFAKCIRASGYISTSDCTTTTTSPGGTTETTMTAINPDILSITEVYFLLDGNDWIKLESITIDELDKDHDGWRTGAGRTFVNTTNGVVTYNYGSHPSVPFVYYWDREENLFGWYPPTDARQTTSNNMRVYFTKRHPDIASDNDNPLLPESLHLAVTDFAAAVGFETRGIIDRANDYWRKYNERLLTYITERKRERTDEEVIMKNYRNR